MDIQTFRALSNDEVSRLSLPLQSLWYDAHDDWDYAHTLIDQEPGLNAAWVHAYLHRKEGDSWNADYWYRRAQRQRPNVSLADEWQQLVLHFLDP